MKKFVTLLVVLGLASAANAGLLTGVQISVNGSLDVTEITIAPSTTLVIDVHVVADQEGLGYLLISPDDAAYGAWYDDLGSYVTGKYENGSGAGDGYPGEFAAKGDFPGSTARVDLGAPFGFGYDFIIAGSVTTPQLPGGKAFEYLYHCEAEGETIIWVLDEEGTELDRVTITQTPEPMTIALLGLGGLFLRRRK